MHRDTKALSGEWEYVAHDVWAFCDKAHQHGAKDQVIFKNDHLTDGGAGSPVMTSNASCENLVSKTITDNRAAINISRDNPHISLGGAFRLNNNNNIDNCDKVAFALIDHLLPSSVQQSNEGGAS